MCTSDYEGIGDWSFGGRPECKKGRSLWDCWYTDDSAKERKCYACRQGYTVNADEVSCTSYEADKNCRVVNSVNGCNICWQGYYFDDF